jgi:hypothetical protein
MYENSNEGGDAAARAPRRARWRWMILLLGGAAIGAAALLLIWQAVIQPPATTQQYRHPNPPVSLPAGYYVTVEGQIAQGLGLSVAQVKAGIAADPSEGLFGVATGRDVAPDELYTIEISALQAAGDQMATTGLWTRQQVDATMQYWRQRDQKALGADMTDWFLHR